MNITIDDLGGTTAVARMTGVEPPSVTAWRRRGIPAERRPAIERALYPRITVESFGVDVRWQRVPDPDWPHPGGRPCIDVAAPAVEASA
jgi:DNA-binding transcriptional regulator YdaS (Cro superfamily)